MSQNQNRKKMANPENAIIVINRSSILCGALFHPHSSSDLNTLKKKHLKKMMKNSK